MQLRGQALSVHMYIFLMQLITNFIDATSVLLLFFITGSMANDLKMFGISYRDPKYIKNLIPSFLPCLVQMIIFFIFFIFNILWL